MVSCPFTLVAIGDAMPNPNLTTGQRVIHVRTNNTYIIRSADHMQKLETGEWIQAVLYQPDRAQTSTTYSRTLISFMEDFANA
jgi:hypothetical protein